MWHCSIAPVGSPVPVATLERIARKQLADVGAAALGEWVEYTGYALHLRRRLSAAEQERVGEAIDLRGTAEAAERWRACEGELPAAARRIAADELKREVS